MLHLRLGALRLVSWAAVSPKSLLPKAKHQRRIGAASRSARAQKQRGVASCASQWDSMGHVSCSGACGASPEASGWDPAPIPTPCRSLRLSSGHPSTGS